MPGKNRALDKNHPKPFLAHFSKESWSLQGHFFSSPRKLSPRRNHEYFFAMHQEKQSLNETHASLDYLYRAKGTAASNRYARTSLHRNSAYRTAFLSR